MIESVGLSDAFPEVIDRVLGHEGGYVNDPNDPGGETQWGISKRSYPDVDIKNLSRADAVLIYKRDFWDAASLGKMPKSIAYQALDFAVNSGIGTAIRALQRAIGVAPDGHIGPVTASKLATASETDTLMLLLAERLEFMTSLKNWPNAGRGWARRIAGNLRYGAQDT